MGTDKNIKLHIVTDIKIIIVLTKDVTTRGKTTEGVLVPQIS